MAQAFLFDLNGTVIDDMHYHARAWYEILNNDLNAGLNWDQVKAQMYGKNEELLIRIFGNGHFTREQLDRLSVEKEKRYQQAYLPEMALIPGLQQFFEQAVLHQVPMAIGSAAIPFNIDFVLDNLHIRHFFQAVVSADDVAISKPHPETFLKAAQLLHASPENCVVFEDAPKGVEAALNAGMKAVVITTMHGKEEFAQYPNVLFYISDYTDPQLKQLLG
ncbi:HAD family hydrolase [Deminuibacter soli]|uniref:HAD family phosphatase n=1 Tax=Deminuibacter soli TaxID=2291815 RepID=A0A3E1NE40_9BACT|nr:HAD family phosphatase [Deminuibacter soli]RFM26235.1 HAD family phosphatase [Deminuibacter soli]